ncbi:hypothetical protein NP233_g4408 [Leucocoprinus birnbaumii]|uniref:ATP-dependent DNA helicase n=1 Tax=Leucocoprinus birnbaumii TaxID=56174 RepID=A0AAD5YXL7_9AGAR|nr:hypothetical protein NP233_g4408 [Leucocoprinus birnbaumii]
MYDNPQLYSMMFPCLFPYGKGSIGNDSLKIAVSEGAQKKWLLMYGDKRFQTDTYFPMIAFNHEQIKKATTGSFILAKRQNFHKIARKILSPKGDILGRIAQSFEKEGFFKPESELEKECFDMINEVYHVGGHVPGSCTQKSYMKNEIWGLVNQLGAPSWFITFSPADAKHPLALYYAGTDTKFSPHICSAEERFKLTAQNPVAAARCFHKLVQLFIKHVLGVDADHIGLYGKTTAYYGTVEQQGRLTLHLHLLLWIDNALSPQEICDKLKANESLFEKELIEYLESCCQGEFLTGSMIEIRAREMPSTIEARGIHTIVDETADPISPQLAVGKDPTLTLPEAPPLRCHINHPEVDESCTGCVNLRTWWDKFKRVVDAVLLRSNIHRCAASVDQLKSLSEQEGSSYNMGGISVKGAPKGCQTPEGYCSARFPREIVPETFVDHTDGYLKIRKLEAMLNTFSDVLTYLMCCNTDVTSLQSGTVVKAIIAYICDYITKLGLRSHHIFQTAHSVFSKQQEYLDKSEAEATQARRLILKVVNALSARMEIGSPLACAYLLGHLDHYTNKTFVTFWWKSFVAQVMQSAQRTEDVEPTIFDAENDCDDESMELLETQSEIDHMEDEEVDEPLPEDDVESDEKNNANRVLIYRKGNRIIGTNPVDDYKDRPDIYEDICLQAWVRGAQKRKIPRRSQRDDRYHLFRSDHPQHDTHEVFFDQQRLKDVVPNYVGGSLPRKDRDDRDYYCCAMMTLFSPWRSGHDLKRLDQSWEEVFSHHSFDDWQLQLMKNFNMRYECLDARDDFQAQRKNLSKTQAPNPLSGSEQTYADSYEEDTQNLLNYLAELDDMGINEDVLKALDEDNPDKEKDPLLKAVNNMITKSGWDAPLPPRSSESAQITEINIPWNVTAREWNARIKAAKNQVLLERRTNTSSRAGQLTTLLQGCDAIESAKRCDIIRLLDANYFLRDFKIRSSEGSELVTSIVKKFTLNGEQERAFRIVSHHASCLIPEQLLMYLGGMGGTGKSRVIHALSNYFELRGEKNRFMLVAPTGTAAALLGGSTYHSMLGFNGVSLDTISQKSASAIINDARERFRGVQYIFIDEISMIACHEMFSISRRLAEITNDHDHPFGGLSMIFAGDFAQISPAIGKALYEKLPPVVGRMTSRAQENMLGKFFWQQVTTVVILKENMRQRVQSVNDEKLQLTLGNMRYGRCTTENLTFLRSRIAHRLSQSTHLLQHGFRNTSVITRFNKCKDHFNKRGTDRFAQDTQQEVDWMYSDDKISGQSNTTLLTNKTRHGRLVVKPRNININVQEYLWNTMPSNMDHIPGKIGLCVGLPVMIRHNVATELCMTKGQEATVVNWTSKMGPRGKKVIDTVYLELSRPPKSVQVAGLPPNIVPLTPIGSTISCNMPGNKIMTIRRHQVPMLPNFSMTDYAAQGKMRDSNVVDLSEINTHQSFYTCLSRSAEADKTVILGSFRPEIITSGISGWLREEFRTLNLLDEITRLRYEGILCLKTAGVSRKQVLETFKKEQNEAWKNSDEHWHPELRWRQGECSDTLLKSYMQESTVEDLAKILRPTKQSKNPDGSTKSDATWTSVYHSLCKRRSEPEGLEWDSVNYSCAFDALLTILFNTWAEQPQRFDVEWQTGSDYLHRLLIDFSSSGLEVSHQNLRSSLYADFPGTFLRGRVYSDLYSIVDRLVASSTYGRLTHHRITTEIERESQSHFILVSQFTTIPVDHVRLDERDPKVSTVFCLELESSYEGTHPFFMFLSLSNGSACYYEPSLRLHSREYELKGVVYTGEGHFTCHFIDQTKQAWFHDGITTGNVLLNEGFTTDWLKLTTGDGAVTKGRPILGFYIAADCSY